ncbi:hypothetical protein M3Y99_00957500 [Aphelenchoides fujianensis]|nr:hypothetical protein M3Y99_00957500 [Aphelenchoides fujianensis]
MASALVVGRCALAAVIFAVCLSSVLAAPTSAKEGQEKRAFDSLTSRGFTAFDKRAAAFEMNKRAFDALTSRGFLPFEKRSFDSFMGTGFSGMDKRSDSFAPVGLGYQKRGFDALTSRGFSGFD